MDDNPEDIAEEVDEDIPEDSESDFEDESEDEFRANLEYAFGNVLINENKENFVIFHYLLNRKSSLKTISGRLPVSSEAHK